MTTTIKSATMPTEKALKVEASVVSDSAVYLNIQGTDDREQIHVKVSDLLDAVRSELGVLIIDKADLPEVVQDDVGDVYVNGLRYSDDLEAHREAALRHFAIAAHLEAHPPVDEQQVEALTAALIEAGLREKVVPAMVARRLVESGYRIEKVQS